MEYKIYKCDYCHKKRKRKLGELCCIYCMVPTVAQQKTEFNLKMSKFNALKERNKVVSKQLYAATKEWLKAQA